MDGLIFRGVVYHKRSLLMLVRNYCMSMCIYCILCIRAVVCYDVFSINRNCTYFQVVRWSLQ